ncbi:MAG TPA: hypothetical protein VG167_12680 [Verrucomicrobiae bacterium]|nr:hypothetical protein [Verrucomicrobiae bacterium]
MSKRAEITIMVDRAKFFEIGRTLQRNWSGKYLGPVTFSTNQGKLTIMSKRGGGELACTPNTQISAELSPADFRKLITAGRREKSPSGPMTLTFRPAPGQLAIDIAGIRARFT